MRAWELNLSQILHIAIKKKARADAKEINIWWCSCQLRRSPHVCQTPYSTCVQGPTCDRWLGKFNQTEAQILLIQSSVVEFFREKMGPAVRENEKGLGHNQLRFRRGGGRRGGVAPSMVRLTFYFFILN